MWRSVHWEGDWSSIQNPTQITLLKNYALIGVFEKRNYPLTVTVKGQGTVQERVIPSKSTDYPHQAVVELTPVPTTGLEFANWGGVLSDRQSPQNVTIIGNKTVMDTFPRNSHLLNININGEGTVQDTVVDPKSYPSDMENL